MKKEEYTPDLFREAFQRYGSMKRFSAGTQIFQKDDPAEKIYYLIKGQVRAYLLYPDGSERTLCYVGKDNLVGEEALARPSARIVCVDAVTDLEMYAMDGEGLERLCFEYPLLQQALMRFYLQKISLLCQWIFYAQFRHSSAKLACLLYADSEKTLTVHYTQDQIAKVTGMSRMSVSSALRQLSKTGVAEPHYGSIRILQREKLKEYFNNQVY